MELKCGTEVLKTTKTTLHRRYLRLRFLANFKKVFKGLLGQPPTVTKVLKDLPVKIITCPIDDSDFTIAEYRKVVDSLEEELMA